MIGHCKLCFEEIENDEHAIRHFEIEHKAYQIGLVITIEELIQD